MNKYSIYFSFSCRDILLQLPIFTTVDRPAVFSVTESPLVEVKLL